MRRYRRSPFNFDSFAVTKREIIASIAIIAMMVLVGMLISGKITEVQTDKNERYNKAVKIISSDIFQYGMRTNAGDAFVYGELEAVDTVTYPELRENYMYVEKVKERYTMHTRTVSNGKTSTVRHYWTWDRVGKEDIMCGQISFCGTVFVSNKIKMPGKRYITTIKESGSIRYVYYGVGTKHTGTVFTTLKDNTILDASEFFENKNIEETIDHLESGVGIVVFWAVWICLTGGCALVFCYFDNKWLE